MLRWNSYTKEVSENDSKDFIINIKDTSAVTLATDDDKQLKAHNILVTLKRLNLSLMSLKMMSLKRT
jgi:hypothetical protein